MNSSKSVLVARLAVLAFVVSIFLPGLTFGQDYEGAEFCKSCHEDNYNDWKASGHPYKLMKGEDAKHRPIPLPRGFDWPEDGEPLGDNDVSYVIGGYKWKSRYIDKDGYIITVTEDESGAAVDGVNQYNYLTGKWSSYHAGEEKKPYNCGTCHTTNWVANPDPTDLSGNQDGLPGMWGTFDDGGVHCEQCHGNGMTMEIDSSAEACGSCHYRTSPPGSEVNSIPASGGFIKHHEQYNEFLASPHASMECTTCHDPHKRGEYSIKEGRECSSCHSSIAKTYAENSMADYNVSCEDCHMPYATKSAQPTGPHAGDLQTHMFYINTDAAANMFTEAGDFVALDENGKGAVTMDFACKRCHETAQLTELSRFAKNFHGVEENDAGELLDELHYVGMNPGLTGHWWGGASRDGEGFLLDFSYSGGSLILIASFYTYDSTGNQTWLVGTGVVTTGSDTVTVSLTMPEGAMWGADFDPTDLPQPRTPWGTADFMFPSCGAGMVSLMPNDAMKAEGFTDYGYDLNRDLTVPGIACPIMMNNPSQIAGN